VLHYSLFADGYWFRILEVGEADRSSPGLVQATKAGEGRGGKGLGAFVNQMGEGEGEIRD
jgi:hypothetical protein